TSVVPAGARDSAHGVSCVSNLPSPPAPLPQGGEGRVTNTPEGLNTLTTFASSTTKLLGPSPQPSPLPPCGGGAGGEGAARPMSRLQTWRSQTSCSNSSSINCLL